MKALKRELENRGIYTTSEVIYTVMTEDVEEFKKTLDEMGLSYEHRNTVGQEEYFCVEI